MRDKITYEWAIEGEDDDGDIQDVDHADTFAEALVRQAALAPKWPKVNIALTRISGNDFDGINERGYSYYRDGKLEPNFSDGWNEDGSGWGNLDPVPQRFHKEVAIVTG